MASHIPSDMLPRMDWNAEDKLAAWSFYRERLEQYFMIVSTPEAKVTHILFYGGKEASERWIALKDQVDETKQKDAETVFKAFVNSSLIDIHCNRLNIFSDLPPNHMYFLNFPQGDYIDSSHNLPCL